MKLIRLLAAVAILGCAANAVAQPLELRVMTFNIKYGTDREHPWEERRPAAVATIEEVAPDLFGTQELLFFQIQDLAREMPQYHWLGLGRAGGSEDEFMAIFYLHERFKVLAFDHFWLSETPETIGSISWDHTNKRMVTWVRFQDVSTGAEFYHWNTHFDHRSSLARQNSAALIRERINRQRPRAPVIVTGDFNAPQEGDVYQAMIAADGNRVDLQDAWTLAEEIVGEQVGTFHSWRGANENPTRIDWILVSPEWKVETARVVTSDLDGVYPSDHFPVVADLVLTEVQAEEQVAD